MTHQLIHNKFVVGFAKAVLNGTRIEIPFIAWHEDSSTTQIHHSQGYGWPGLLLQAVFANPVKPRRSTTGSMEPLRGTNKATWCVKLLSMTVYVYQVDYVSFCALLRTQCCCLSHCGWYCPPSASHPPSTPTPPLPPTHPL